MNEIIPVLAKELAEHINKLVDLPFVNEKDEEMFFQLLVTKVFELSCKHLILWLYKK